MPVRHWFSSHYSLSLCFKQLVVLFFERNILAVIKIQWDGRRELEGGGKGERKKKKMPCGAMDQHPSPDLIRQHLRIDVSICLLNLAWFISALLPPLPLPTSFYVHLVSLCPAQRGRGGGGAFDAFAVRNAIDWEAPDNWFLRRSRKTDGSWLCGFYRRRGLPSCHQLLIPDTSQIGHNRLRQFSQRESDWSQQRRKKSITNADPTRQMTAFFAFLSNRRSLRLPPPPPPPRPWITAEVYETFKRDRGSRRGGRCQGGGRKGERRRGK